MIDILKRIWAGPLSVKFSLIFLLLTLVPVIVAAPGKVIFALLLLYSVFRLISWIVDGE